MTKRCSFALLVFGIWGCAGGPSPEGSAYVVLDAEARAAGVVVEAETIGQPALPMELDPEQAAAVRVGSRRTALALEPGTLAVVRGAQGSVETHKVGVDIDEDHLLIVGDEEGARELAALLAGDLGSREDGFWVLAVPDVFERTSFVELPRGVVEVLPQARAKDDGTLEQLQAGGGQAPGSFEVRTSDAFEKPELVGLYSAKASVLLLDAGGGFTLEDDCTGGGRMLTGRYILSRGVVELASSGGETIRLGLHGGSLVDMDGAKFEPRGIPAADEPGELGGAK